MMQWNGLDSFFYKKILTFPPISNLLNYTSYYGCILQMGHSLVPTGNRDSRTLGIGPRGDARMGFGK